MILAVVERLFVDSTTAYLFVEDKKEGMEC